MAEANNSSGIDNANFKGEHIEKTSIVEEGNGSEGQPEFEIVCRMSRDLVTFYGQKSKF